MREWLYEFAMVSEVSVKTRWAIYLGIGIFIAITVIGHYQVANFELHGQAQSYQEALKLKFAKHYDKAAFGALFSFMGLAYKSYKREKKNLWS